MKSSRTHKFQLPSSKNKFIPVTSYYPSKNQVTAYIRTMSVSQLEDQLEDQLETIMVTEQCQEEPKADDNQSRDVVSQESAVTLIVNEPLYCDHTSSAELHQLYEDKQTIVKMTMNPLYAKKIDMKDMVSMVLSHSKMRKLENKYGWNS
jgi:hypothetical protein